MVNLAALVLILTSSAPQTTLVIDPPHTSQAQNAPVPAARQLTPEQKAWFAHAVDHILTGD